MVEVECPTCSERVLLSLDEDEEFTVDVESVPAGSRLVVTARGLALPVHECGGPTREQKKADRIARARAPLPILPAWTGGDEVADDVQWQVRIHHNGTEHTIVLRPLSDGDGTDTRSPL